MNVVPIRAVPEPEPDNQAVVADLLTQALDAKFNSAMVLGEVDGKLHMLWANLTPQEVLWNMEQGKQILITPPSNAR